MSRARIEEASESDLSDPEEVDIGNFADHEIMRRRVPENSMKRRAPDTQPSLKPEPDPRNMMPDVQFPETCQAPMENRSLYASFQCLYPVYFDASRSRAEGRRVSLANAVHNPLAREVANACMRLRLQVLLEPERQHPKDWANPGRVRVGLKHVPAPHVKNKHHLYTLIAAHLKENPTTENSHGLRVRISGELHPDANKPYPRLNVPRGWKMSPLVPFLSPAMTGGGVSEDLFKDVLKDMQNRHPTNALLADGNNGGDNNSKGGKKKKDKKGKGRA